VNCEVTHKVWGKLATHLMGHNGKIINEKTSRGGYGDDALQQALAAVKAGMSLKTCASVYSMPHATL